MIALDETALRRDSFRPGPIFADAHGQAWTLPALDMVVIARVPALRKYVHAIVTGQNLLGRWPLARAAVGGLLQQNYLVSDSDLDEIIGPLDSDSSWRPTPEWDRLMTAFEGVADNMETLDPLEKRLLFGEPWSN